ncbi:hypothetical protein RHMOL_Rhmol06G0103300 [Rhododendron molle]|uniref:Uncharacterized protein n=1 Tax=Rhododendron molle TaxID=49168 RepID=A0ACC0NBY8_RHOML|nr:hypothetical protein RHMOL_Rhmol06G0103300 [Rhododendron molle]
MSDAEQDEKFREFVRASLAGKNVAMATMTSSGKSFCYNLSVLEVLFQNLFVVIDEAHAYKGAFGCHTALILRRLRRLCSHVYGSDPSFVFCTTTSGNPREHAMELANLPTMELIQNDGSLSGRKLFVLWNTPLNPDTVLKITSNRDTKVSLDKNMGHTRSRDSKANAVDALLKGASSHSGSKYMIIDVYVQDARDQPILTMVESIRRAKSGKPKTNRRKGPDEPKTTSSGVRKYYITLRCGQCKQPCHNTRTCPHKSTNSTGEQGKSCKHSNVLGRGRAANNGNGSRGGGRRRGGITATLPGVVIRERNPNIEVDLGTNKGAKSGKGKEPIVGKVKIPMTRFGGAESIVPRVGLPIPQAASSSAASCGSGSGSGSAIMPNTHIPRLDSQGATSTPSTQRSAI